MATAELFREELMSRIASFRMTLALYFLWACFSVLTLQHRCSAFFYDINPLYDIVHTDAEAYALFSILL